MNPEPTRILDPPRALSKRWQRGESPDLRQFIGELGPLNASAIGPIVRVDQRERWIRGEKVAASVYLDRFPELGRSPELAVEIVYGEFLLREEVGEAPQAQEYIEAYPEIHERLAVQFELYYALKKHPAKQRKGRGGKRPARAQSRSADDPRLPEIPGYEVLQELGRGGMSVVYKAREFGLGRVVALKVIRRSDLANKEALIRFRQEAEVIARLKHPNIVRIHKVGDIDECPFIELEYIKGGSLDRRCGDAPWPARDAARLIETVARAIQEAHALRIVHRDLKPANILLDDVLVPKITDFGLAKCMELDGGLTRSQALLGSPRYMAPEQAAGLNSAIGPATDIHALGVILYELLTGRPPFLAETPYETLAMILSHDTVPPSRLQRMVPRDLEIICLKCLQKDPGRRYASAQDLAEDLRRFLAGESIHARPTSTFERAWRWCRRSPAQAALSAGLVLAIVAGFAGVAVQWMRAESNLEEIKHQRSLLEINYRSEQKAHKAEQEAHSREEVAHQRAQARFDLTLRAINTFTELAHKQDLLKDPSTEVVRKRLLMTALNYYKSLQRELTGDPSPRALGTLSSALTRIGAIQMEVGSKAEALEAYERALQLIQVAVDQQPDIPERLKVLARGHLCVGLALRALGRPSRAQRSFKQGRDVLEKLLRDRPGDTEARDALAWQIGNISAVLQEAGKYEESIQTAREVLEIREDLSREAPADPGRTRDLAWCEQDLGASYVSAGRPGEGLPHAEKSVALLIPVTEARPQDAEARRRLASCLFKLSYNYRVLGRRIEARRAIDRGLAFQQALRDTFPFVVLHQSALAQAIILDATLWADDGRLEEAIARIDQAEKLMAGLTGNDAGAPWYNLACALGVCAAKTNESGRVNSGDSAATSYRNLADRAMKALRRASAAGFADFGLLQTDPDLASLRSLPDFQAIATDASFPAYPFAE